MRRINYLRVEIVPDQKDKFRMLKIEVLHSGKEKVDFEHFFEVDDFESAFDTLMDMAKEVIKREIKQVENK